MNERSWQRILILHGGAIGDLVLALPAIAGVRRSAPQAQIELLGHPALLPLLKGRGLVDRVDALDSLPLYHLFNGKMPESLRERLTSFDLIISWFGSGNDAYRQTVSRLPARTLVARSIPPADGRIHAVDHLIQTLEPLGITTEERTPRLALMESERRMADQLLGRMGAVRGPLVALHPGSGSPRKCWPAERFAALVLALLQREMAVVVIEGPADERPVEEVFSRVAERGGAPAPHRLFRLREVSLLDVAVILDRSVVYVGNDSGITHLAAALGVPTVAIFTVTDPRVWGPRGNVVILEGFPPVDAVLAELDASLLVASAPKR